MAKQTIWRIFRCDEPAAPSIRICGGLSTDWYPEGDRFLLIVIRDGLPVAQVSPLNPLAEKNEIHVPGGIIAADAIFSADGKHIIAAFNYR